MQGLRPFDALCGGLALVGWLCLLHAQAVTASPQALAPLGANAATSAPALLPPLRELRAGQLGGIPLVGAQLRTPGVVRLRGGGRKKEETSEDDDEPSSDGVVGSKVGKSPGKSPKKKSEKKMKRKKEVSEESEESEGANKVGWPALPSRVLSRPAACGAAKMRL